MEANILHRIDVEEIGLIEIRRVRTVTGSGVFDEELVARTIRDAQRELGRGYVTINVVAYTNHNGEHVESFPYPIEIYFEGSITEFYDGSQRAALRFSSVDDLIAWFKNKKYGARILKVAVETAEEWLRDKVREREADVKMR